MLRPRCTRGAFYTFGAFDGGWIWVKNPTSRSRGDSQDNVVRLQAEFSSSLSGKGLYLCICCAPFTLTKTKLLTPVSSCGCNASFRFELYT